MPEGLYTDESFHLLRAQEIVRGQALPVFITGNGGYEPLFVYLTGAMLPILGPVQWVGRLVAAWLGLISVAATIRVGKEFFPGRPVGTLAGLSLATLIWSLTFSRFGSQPIIAATASAGTLAAFWHGVRTRSWRAYALAGLCMGLGLDGYVAFRLFPLVLLVAGLALLIGKREAWRHWIRAGAITGHIAGFVFLPLAVFFIQNPRWFFDRFDQTAGILLNVNDRLAVLAFNLLKVIGGLFVQGDQNWRHNLAGRPALDIVQTLFFGLGLIVTIRQWRRPEAWVLSAWLVAGLLPSVITVEAPHFGRTTMAMPAVVLIVALGIEAVWRLGRNRLARGLVIAAVACSGLLSTYDYFGRWASAPQLYDAFSGDQVHLARDIEKLSTQKTNLYMTPKSIADTDYWSLTYLLDPQHFNRRITFGDQLCGYYPDPNRDAVYMAIDDPGPLTELKMIFPIVQVVGRLPSMETVYIPAGQEARWPVDHPRLVRFGDFVDLLGYTVTPTAPLRGQALQLTTIWQANQTTLADYKIFLHLIGTPKADGSTIYSQLDPRPCGQDYPTWKWQPGDVLRTTYSLPVSSDLPAGAYALEMGWYDEAAAVRLPASDESHQPLGDNLTLANFQFAPSAP